MASALPTDVTKTSKKNLWEHICQAICTEIIELHPATGGCGSCQNYILPIDNRILKGMTPSFPVDIIYTWVDGSDKNHKRKLNNHLPNQSNIHPNGLEAARFRDNEELRYSLRSIEAFAPWVRRIIIVTDNQKPIWLNTDNKKISIVDHKEFIPHSYLPTFNSHVIESFLHLIPNLAEHYIYLNDDVFLARPTSKNSFFTTNGLPFGFVDWRARRLSGYKFTQTPHAQSYFNTLNILANKHIATDKSFITAHGPYPQTRSNAINAFAFYQDIIKGFAINKFRTTEEIAFYSHGIPLWAYNQKTIVPCDETYYYVQTKRRDRLAYYNAILNSQQDRKEPLFFCINDVGDHKKASRHQEDLHKILSTYFPKKSEYEQSL